MKVLIVGSGGREHALAWKFAQSEKVTQILCIPGNGGTATMPKCQNLSFAVSDFEGIRRFASVQGVALTVIGPELPLAMGIVDYFHDANLPVFGPTQVAAQIESSKSWAKELMISAGIPTAASATFTDPELAKAYVRSQSIPIVIKADGLASGKGVTVATTLDQALGAIEQMFTGQFGTAGERVLIEEYLAGQEVSILAVTDGDTIRPLLPAQDYKRLKEGNLGPNTGGMGAYAPSVITTPQLMAEIQTTILEPTIAALRDRGINYCGCLYAGLMITPEGKPKVIEFNARFGDPETQAILPLLNSPLEDLLLACVEKRLGQFLPISWKPGSSVCVVMTSAGYPETTESGKLISGIKKAEENGAAVFQAGTKIKDKSLVTNGGRVLGVSATGKELNEAIATAYRAVSHISYDGANYRRDIGVIEVPKVLNIKSP
ncbi:phosphoribosylamine--glycine ligase [Synechococcus sp. PCC 7502]|uniref:phosphoribosylamine--glycine ligase n=1 Tax=Synechococcus sp. PCC 7502 TaxID=1173263 RepID=UPI00029FFDC4|nr:phosphoribosylamine--glycine ligase [Synechococcus sp. PCC 7502]AFY72189.1 phosphoribosylamine--glycine ligase [Synechococcus sp. PCC 7502]